VCERYPDGVDAGSFASLFYRVNKEFVQVKGGYYDANSEFQEDKRLVHNPYPKLRDLLESSKAVSAIFYPNPTALRVYPLTHPMVHEYKRNGGRAPAAPKAVPPSTGSPKLPPSVLPPSVDRHLKQVVSSAREGCMMGSQFPKAYKDMHGRPLDYQTLGFSKMKELFNASQTIKFVPDGSSGMLYLIDAAPGPAAAAPAGPPPAQYNNSSNNFPALSSQYNNPRQYTQPVVRADGSYERHQITLNPMDLECPVCFGRYCSTHTNDPCTAPCGHTVCADCLSLIFTQHGAMCPQCRAPMPRNTPVNWTLKSICVSAVHHG